MIVASVPGQEPRIVFAPLPKTEIEPEADADALCAACDHQGLLATFWADGFALEPAETPHLSRRVYDLLREAGWTVDEEARTITARVRRIAEAGSVSDGTRIVTLRWCERHRWLEAVVGDIIEGQADQREFDDPRTIVAHVLDAAYGPGAARRAGIHSP